MAKRSTQNDDAPPPEFSPDDAAEAAILEAIGAAGGEMSAFKVFVFRLSGPNKKPDGKEARLFECGADDLEGVPDRLAHDYGEGVYRVRVRKDGRQFGRYWDIEIELSPAERQAFQQRNRESFAAPVPAAPAAAPATSPAAPAAGGDVIAILLAQMKQQNDMLMAFLTKAPAASPNPLDIFTQTVAAFKGFTDLMPKSEAQTGLSMFEKGMDFAEKFMDRGGSGEKTSLLGVVREIFSNPEVIKTIREVGQARPAIAAPARAAATPAAAPAGGVAKAPEEQAMEYLISQAVAGMQPELAFETALRIIPETTLQQLDHLVETVSEAAALDLLLAQYPAAAPHRAWFAALLGAIYAEEEPPLEGQEDGEAEAAPDAGGQPSAVPDVPTP